MSQLRHTKETTQSPNNKANAKLDDKANAKSSTHNQEIEKMTTDIVDTAEKVTLSEISEVKVYIHEQMNASNDGLRSEIHDVKTELKAEINDVKTELKAEINDVKTELKGEMNTFRAEVNSKFDALHKEMIKHFRWTIGIIAVLVGPTMGAVIMLAIKIIN